MTESAAFDHSAISPYLHQIATALNLLLKTFCFQQICPLRVPLHDRVCRIRPLCRFFVLVFDNCA
ncbi:MAG: hypothetical protein IJC11_03745 [Alphaproteobacteria bacterium]|nr:hypothetical protein [Alphaproteobacteria bacterium]